MLRKLHRAAALAAVLGASLFAPSGICRAEDPLQILFYGNSFTNATCCGSSRSVPNILQLIVTAAGHPAFQGRNASVDGQTMQWHLTNNTSVINTGIAAGDDWDVVVLQDYSTWPTHVGNLPQHLSSMLAMYQAVAARSPNVQVVEYETWARGYSHSYYSGATPDFPGGPAQMQQELRDGYNMSNANINAAVGHTVSEVARAGDAWELANWPANFYGDGNYHASNRGSMLNALVLYSAIYNDPTTSDINLSSVLTTLGLSAADGQLLTSLADQVAAVPEPATWALVVSGVGVLAIRRKCGRRG